MIDFETISHNWQKVKEQVEAKAIQCGRKPSEITIVAVSKTHPAEFIDWGLKAGIKIFGENYAQELRDKHDAVSLLTNETPQWHFIGHLQTNKVKYIIPFVSLVHSVDNLHLAQEIAKQAEKQNRNIDILLQVNTSGELSKSGCQPDEIFDLYEQAALLKNLKIKGLMTIGSFSSDVKIIRSEFQILRKIKEGLDFRYPDSGLTELSMGMSGDFELAIEEGATMVRIGSAIFGVRN